MNVEPSPSELDEESVLRIGKKRAVLLTSGSPTVVVTARYAPTALCGSGILAV